MHDPVRKAVRQVWRDGELRAGTRLIPEETAIALTYNGGTAAVMMGTPRDLRDFAIGFSLSEGIVQSRDEILSLDVVELDDGIELRMWLAPATAGLINERRRHVAGLPGARNSAGPSCRREDSYAGARGGRERRTICS